MSLGIMNKAAGGVIGALVGEVLEVDADDDDLAIGEYMRIKIRLDIRKPIMREVTLDLGAESSEKTKWCPLVYEYLLDFYYACGLILAILIETVRLNWRRELNSNLVGRCASFQRRGLGSRPG